MFEDVVIASLYRQFHRNVDDSLLDQAARSAGCPSGIGRLCLLGDAMLEALTVGLELNAETSLLDIGCGRGFLERWLQHVGSRARVTGIDRVPEGLAAARALAPGALFIEDDYRTHQFAERFDTAVALELAISGKIDESLIAALRACLREGGRFAVTSASIDGRHAERLDAAVTHFRRYFPEFEVVDHTLEAAAFAKRTYGAWLGIDTWGQTIQRGMHDQARKVLNSIERGEFHYAIVSGRA